MAALPHLFASASVGIHVYRRQLPGTTGRMWLMMLLWTGTTFRRLPATEMRDMRARQVGYRVFRSRTTRRAWQLLTSFRRWHRESTGTTCISLSAGSTFLIFIRRWMWAVGRENLAEVLRQDYNITCITLTRDNAQNVGWFYDLPFNERAAARHNLPIISSGIRRQPFPDLSIDFFHSRSAVPLSLDEEVNAGMLLDWDRMLRPGGYVALLSITTDFLLPYNGRTSNSSEHNKLSGFAHTLSHVAHKVGWEAICPVSGCVFRRALPVHRPENGDSKDDSAMMLTGDYHVRLFRKPMR